MTVETQKAKILQYCEKYGSITIRDAFVKLYINSPSKRISEMRQCGYEVKSIDETKINADGAVVKYKRYFITKMEGDVA